MLNQNKLSILEVLIYYELLLDMKTLELKKVYAVLMDLVINILFLIYLFSYFLIT